MTAREYAQTLELLELHGIAHHVVGPRHGGAGASARRARSPAGCRRCAGSRSARGFDVALAHGSHELTLTARSLGIPSATAFDYEFAWLQHQLGLPRGDAGRLPGRDPGRAARPLRRAAAEAPPLPGTQGGVLPRRLRARPAPSVDGVDPSDGARRRPHAAGRRRSTTGTGTRSSPTCSSGSAATSPCTPSSSRARTSSGTTIRALGLPSLLVPEHAVDAQSLIALADLVVSAGGTMNREAVALGVPVYTTFAGRLGAVDERLIRGRAAAAADRRERARAAQAGPRRGATGVRRDPRAAARAACFPRRRAIGSP